MTLMGKREIELWRATGHQEMVLSGIGVTETSDQTSDQNLVANKVSVPNL